jgi:hypothetical protein
MLLILTTPLMFGAVLVWNRCIRDKPGFCAERRELSELKHTRKRENQHTEVEDEVEDTVLFRSILPGCDLWPANSNLGFRKSAGPAVTPKKSS